MCPLPIIAFDTCEYLQMHTDCAFSLQIPSNCGTLLAVLLQRTLDPPDSDVIEDALSLLVQMRTLVKTSPRGRYESTFYGRLLASFSLSFDASVLILKFGAIGMLREGILLGVLMDTQPLPIIRPFGDEILVSTQCLKKSVFSWSP